MDNEKSPALRLFPFGPQMVTIQCMASESCEKVTAACPGS
jgi:hypothetical protein